MISVSEPGPAGGRQADGAGGAGTRAESGDTLARRLGLPAHHSLLLRKAARLGLPDADALVALAVARGCRHYADPRPGALVAPAVPRARFSDEELAVALLSPALPYNPRAVRAGAQLLGAEGVQPQRLARRAVRERAQTVLRHVARAGRDTEPQERFWGELLAALAALEAAAGRPAPAPPPGVLPHPSRFRSETGWSGPHGGPSVTWLRPARPSQSPAGGVGLRPRP